MWSSFLGGNFKLHDQMQETAQLDVEIKAQLAKVGIEL